MLKFWNRLTYLLSNDHQSSRLLSLIYPRARERVICGRSISFEGHRVEVKKSRAAVQCRSHEQGQSFCGRFPPLKGGARECIVIPQLCGRELRRRTAYRDVTGMHIWNAVSCRPYHLSPFPLDPLSRSHRTTLVKTWREICWILYEDFFYERSDWWYGAEINLQRLSASPQSRQPRYRMQRCN